MPLKRANNTRGELLDAAARIVTRDGVSKLTLDAVAHEAGVSKGCVLYHFAGKNSLIEGMIDNLTAQVKADHARFLAADRGGRGRWIRAYVLASVPLSGKVSAGVFAAMANEPALLHAVQENYAEWQRETEADGMDPVLTTAVRLAVSGLWMSEVLGLAPPTGEMRDRVVARLIEMVTPEE
jgi:AcrR family transcriptional regulator